MEEYRAPFPSSLVYPRFFQFLKYVTFRPGMIAKNVLPALIKKKLSPEKISLIKEGILGQHEVELEEFLIHTADGAALDTIQIIPKGLDQSASDAVFIIKFKGQKSFFENSLKEDVEDAIAARATMICFNYRGVGRSRKLPAVFLDLVIDGIAQVQRLLDTGVKSHQILLDGESLGGAIATVVAFYFHQQNLPIYLVNARSFGSLEKTAIEMTFPNATDFFKRWAYGYLHFWGWGADIAEKYRSIPTDYKMYLVITKEKEGVSEGDGKIPHQCSLHLAVRPAEKANDTTTGYKFHATSCEKSGHVEPRKNLIFKTDPQLNAQEVVHQRIDCMRFSQPHLHLSQTYQNNLAVLDQSTASLTDHPFKL